MRRIKLALLGGFTLVVLGGAFTFTAGTASAHPPSKVEVCHHTSSETNPFVVINISHHAVEQHLANHGGTGPDTVGAADCTADDDDLD